MRTNQKDDKSKTGNSIREMKNGFRKSLKSKWKKNKVVIINTVRMTDMEDRAGNLVRAQRC